MVGTFFPIDNNVMVVNKAVECIPVLHEQGISEVKT